MNAARPTNLRQPPTRIAADVVLEDIGAAVNDAPKPDWNATGVALVGIGATAAFSSGILPADLAHEAAIGVLLSVVASVAVEARAGVRNIMRADIIAILAFFYLTLYEFLFRQPFFNSATSLASTEAALNVVYLGMCSLFIGRHVPRPKKLPLADYLHAEMPIGKLLFLFWIAVGLGYFYMLACSGWNPVTMVNAMMGARFSQPWSRGALGDWRSIFSEMALLLYLIPALAGVMLARAHRYSIVHLLPVVLVLIFTLFQGFVTGTRNIFGAYLVNFLVGYAFASPPSKRTRVVVVSALCAMAMAFSTYVMLQFREFGLKNWLKGDYDPTSNLQSDFVFVDYNLLTIATMADFYPQKHPYLGAEIPYLAIIRPIPRFLWPGKPTGMSKSIEEIMGYDEGVTISATFAGEAYISGGYWAVLAIGLVLGAVTGSWSLMASPRNSELGILVYASGFFAAVISMRSLFAFTTAMLPTVASLALVIVMVDKAQSGGKRLVAMLSRRPAPLRPPGPPQRRAPARARFAGAKTLPSNDSPSAETE